MVEIFIGLVKFIVELMNDMGLEGSKKILSMLVICSLSLNVYLIEKVLSLAETIFIDVSIEDGATTVPEPTKKSE